MFKYKTVAYCNIRVNKDVPSDEEKDKISKASAEMGLCPNQHQPDLLYVEDVLVSTGSNLNDDVFLPEEIIKAIVEKDSVKLKPVNWEHLSTDIIGVMYDSSLVDKDGKELDMHDDEMKKMVHSVVSRSAIWRYIHPDKANIIAKAAQDDSYFVSMECYFNDYDYLVDEEVIQRNEKTSSVFDEHLKANGGTGRYNGRRVKRVLRDIVFGGKGIVKNPANPESYILSVAEKNTKGDIMTEEQMKDLQEKLNTALAENEALKKEIDSFKQADANKKIADLEQQNKESADKIKVLEDKVKMHDEVSNKLQVAETELASTKEMLVKAEQKIKDFEAKIEKEEKEKKLVARKEQILKVIALEGEDLENELKDIVEMTDEKFTAYLSKIQKFTEKAKASVKQEPKKEDNKDNVTDILDTMKGKTPSAGLDGTSETRKDRVAKNFNQIM